MSDIINLGFIGHRIESPGNNGIDSHVYSVIKALSERKNYSIFSYCHQKSITLDGHRTFIQSYLPQNSIFRPFNALIGAATMRLKGVHVLHLHGLNATLFILLMRLFFFRKIVFTFHSNDWRYPKWNFFEKIIIYSSFLSVKLARVHEVYISKSFLSQYGWGGRSYLIYSGIFDLNARTDFKLNNYTEFPLVVVGRITPEKQQLEMADYFCGKARIVKFYGDICSNEYSKNFLDIINSCNNLIHCGLIDNDALRTVLGSSIYINASSFEGLSIANVEGSFFSPYVFMSNIPANREIGLPRKYYFSTFRSLDEKLKSLSDYEIEKKIRREIFDRFSVDLSIQSLSEVYEL